MNPNELKMLIALQPKIKNAMGSVQYRDLFIWKSDTELSVHCCITPKLLDDASIIRIPLTIDPVNPERGLWGMLDWGKWSDHGITPNGNYIWFMASLDEEPSILETPTEAILKALCVQWEVKV
jgi:hypothetical protein